MKTYTLEEAAEILKMQPEALRLKLKKGEIPGAKPGKRWVIFQDDLAEYLRSLYPKFANTLQGVSEISRRKTWHSTKEVIYGGSKLIITEEKYNKALGHRIR